MASQAAEVETAKVRFLAGTVKCGLDVAGGCLSFGDFCIGRRAASEETDGFSFCLLGPTCCEGGGGGGGLYFGNMVFLGRKISCSSFFVNRRFIPAWLVLVEAVGLYVEEVRVE
ncbi:hypothetical protein GE061_000958 [Apolygus lucorum]|uniref:Uncharacterized protein n=1 Tax=Apolygus lucorum TaxID=248454 RepID=A0A8S9Y6Y7_APOLU|nr:hypothetical protein GE061_000958 [Apolygus lucorum]